MVPAKRIVVPTKRIIWEILPALFVYLGAPELLCLAKTCSYLHALVAFRLPRLYDIDAFLEQVFGCSAEFRFLQACTGLFISGSRALQFLDRTSYRSSDADLYVGARTAFVVLDWLIQRGFILLSSRSPFRQGSISISELLRRARARGSSYFLGKGNSLFQFISPCGSLKVDLIVTMHSAFSAICNFHSTAVMNFISAHCAVSLFPLATLGLDRRSMVVRYERTKRMTNVIAKYVARGFTPPTAKEIKTLFAAGPRWVRDSSRCWVLELPPIPSGPFNFWTSRRYDLSLFHSDKFRQGMSYWYRMGFVLFTANGNGKVAFAQFGYDGVHDYCTPPEFARRQVVLNSARIFSVIQQDTDMIIDAFIASEITDRDEREGALSGP